MSNGPVDNTAKTTMKFGSSLLIPIVWLAAGLGFHSIGYSILESILWGAVVAFGVYAGLVLLSVAIVLLFVLAVLIIRKF